MTTPAGTLERYVPNIAAEWDLDAPGRRLRQVDGTLCFVDISGFTNLSEKLARRGRIGAEELTEVLDRVFGSMLRLAYDRGGSLLKFGGDALLLLFQGPDHPLQAAGAAVEMRAALRQATTIPTSVGRIALRMSVGLHTGRVDLFRVGKSHRELVITGPAATTTTEMEKTAEAGEILVSPALREALPAGAATTPKGPGWLLRWRKALAAGPGPTARRVVSEEAVALAVPPVLRRHLATARAEPEHRVATVAFVKFKGVDRALAEGGPEAVAEGLEAVVCATQEAADTEGVTFLATDIDEDGGKVILVAGVPGAQEDDEGRMLRAVRRIADAGVAFPLRIGVNRGHVFAGEIGTDFRSTYTVMGDTVNLAARLMAAAPAGAVYASPSVLDRSRTLFETTALEPFRVKGKTAPVQAYAVGRQGEARVERAHGELPFTGRASEVERLEAVLDSAAAGRGAVVTILGDTGIGKSRLVEHVLSLRPGLPRIVLRAEPYGANNPYWAFRDPLRSVLEVDRTDQTHMRERLHEAVAARDPALLPLLSLIGDVAHVEVPETPESAAIDPRFRPDRTADAIERLLAASFSTSLAIVVEDGHWLDDASAHLLRRLAATTSSHPWILLATARETDGGFRPGVGEAVVLAPLTDDEARELVIATTEAAPLRPHEVEAITRRSGGNPLFLEEIVRVVRETGSADGLPDSLDAVVSAEIDSLPPLPRRLLRYSSVLGRSFRRVVLDSVLAPEAIEIDAATRRALARFIEEDGPERWRFRHAVMHDVAYNGLSYRKKRELHGRAGEVIERLAGTDPDSVAEFLALHYSLAGDHERAWRYGLVAGEKARSTYANEEAAGHYERALESARQIGAGRLDRVDALSRLGEVHELAGRFPDSLEAYRRASHLVPDDPLRQARLLLQRARTRMHEGSYRTALAEASRGRRLIEFDPHPDAAALRARLVAIRAHLRQRQHRPAQALDLAVEAIREAEQAGDEEALARAYLISDWANHVLGSPHLAVHAEKALAIYQSRGDLDGAGNVLNNLGGVAYFEGRWDDAVERYQQAENSYRRAGNEASAAVARGNLAELLVSQFRSGEAEPVITDAIRVLRAAGSTDDLLFVELQQGRLLLNQGDYDGAIASLSDLRRRLLDLGQTGFAFEAAVQHSLALVACGREAEVPALLEEAVAAVGEVDALYAPMLARIRGSALAAGGSCEEAAEVLGTGAEQARAQGLLYEEGLLLLAKATCTQRAGRAADASGIARGRELLTRCGVRLDGAPRHVLLPT